MNFTIDRLLDEAKLTAVQEMFEPELYKFAELLVKETIDELIQQMWNNGIDESNNPQFYKSIDATVTYFGASDEHS